jgi:TolB-like protein/Tfp pilus assembly protein PilF
MTSVWGELKRRNVVRVAIAYGIVSWLILQLTDVLVPLLTLPEWVGRFVFFLIVIGFILALFLSWAYELTPEGVKLEKHVDRSQSITHATGRKLDFAIIAMLVVALAYFVWESRFEVSSIENGSEVVANEAEITATSQQRTIAVLPFVNMSSDEEQEYFSDGLSEELLNLLARIPELRVTSRSSAFFYKGKEFKIADVGRELGVDHILEGSVRRSGDTIRITAQLIEVDSDVHVWSETWDRTFADVFVIQDEIAEAVVSALKIRLLGDTPRSLATAPEAYAMYLQSENFSNLLTKESMQQAEALLIRALEIDEHFAPGWARLSLVYLRGSGTGTWPPIEAAALARSAAEKALSIDDGNVGAHIVLSGIARTYEYDPEVADRELDIAVSLAPNDGVVLRELGRRFSAQGNYKRAIPYGEQAALMDPLNPLPKRLLAYNHIEAGDNDAAVAVAKEGLALNPAAVQFHFQIGIVHFVNGEYERALEEYDRESLDGFRSAGRAVTFFAMGDSVNADVELAHLIDLGIRWTYEIASVHAYRGELDEAFAWLDRAMARRDQSLARIQRDPFMTNLYDDPRYEPLLEKLGQKRIAGR